MTNIVFDNDATPGPVDTNLQDINEANITDATAAAYNFSGNIKLETFAIIDRDEILAISNGECEVVCGGTATYVAIKTTGGSLGLYTNPQI